MAKQTINIGSSPNDGSGDTLRTGGDKINDNFDELYPATPTDLTGVRYGDHGSYDGTSMAIQTLVWKDLLGTPIARTNGATDPAFVAFRGAVDAYAFTANDEIQLWFHLPHDYAQGTDIFLHVHWSHNGTAISGDMVWNYAATYAKGHDQANFPAPVTGTISYSTVDIATTPQYRHRVDEIQLSASSPSASQLDTDDLEVDGIIGVNISAGTIPTITGGSPNEPFMFMVDIHYQSDIQGTKNKAPNFYE